MKLIPFLLILLVAGSFVYVNLPLYQTKFDLSYWQSVYEHSQYCVPRCEFRGNIDDPELYSYAGIRYIAGGDPAAINPEVQPLTKYLFGLSIRAWGNALPLQLILGTLCLILLYYLARQILGPVTAVIPPFLLAIDPLFIDQLKRPFVDLSLTFWVLLYTVFLTRSRHQVDWWWGGLVLGALSLAKSFSYGLLFGLITAVILYVGHSLHSLRLLAKIFLVATITYCAGYVMFFVRGHSLVDFVWLHLETLRLYKDYVPEYPKGEVFRLIFTGQWQTWWGDKNLVASPFYSLAWPISFAGYVLACLTRLRHNHIVTIHLIIITIMLFFLSSRLLFPRYLLPILPSLYLVLAYLLQGLPNLLQLSYGRSAGSIRTSE